MPTRCLRFTPTSHPSSLPTPRAPPTPEPLHPAPPPQRFAQTPPTPSACKIAHTMAVALSSLSAKPAFAARPAASAPRRAVRAQAAGAPSMVPDMDKRVSWGASTEREKEGVRVVRAPPPGRLPRAAATRSSCVARKEG